MPLAAQNCCLSSTSVDGIWYTPGSNESSEAYRVTIVSEHGNTRCFMRMPETVASYCPVDGKAPCGLDRRSSCLSCCPQLTKWLYVVVMGRLRILAIRTGSAGECRRGKDGFTRLTQLSSDCNRLHRLVSAEPPPIAVVPFRPPDAPPSQTRPADTTRVSDTLRRDAVLLRSDLLPLAAVERTSIKRVHMFDSTSMSEAEILKAWACFDFEAHARQCAVCSSAARNAILEALCGVGYALALDVREHIPDLKPGLTSRAALPPGYQFVRSLLQN